MAKMNSLKNFNIYELQQMHNLSVRSINGCVDAGLVTLYAIINYYFKHGNFTYLRRCGAKCNNELINICQYYIAKYQLTKDMLIINAADQEFDEFKLYVHNNFNIDSATAEYFRESYKQKSFELFKFILIVLQNALSEKEYYIFLNNYNFFKGYNKLSYQEIGDRFGLTRERARQIYKALPRIIAKIISKLKKCNLPMETYVRAYDDLQNMPNYYHIDNAFAERINFREGINITPKLCCFLLSSISDKNYIGIQDIDVNAQCYYAINKTYFDKVKLDKIYTYFENISKKRRPKEIVMSITDLIKSNMNYSTGHEISNNDVLHRFLKDVSSTCFGFVSGDNTITAPRNTLTKLSEHIELILKQNGTPMTLDEIYNKILETTNKHPTYESLRSSILNTDDVVAIGKTSTYALKSWSDINTKKIKDIVYEYLSMTPGVPQSIADITDYVTQFRKTNAKNIRTNLKLDKTGRFIFERGNYIKIAVDKNDK